MDSASYLAMILSFLEVVSVLPACSLRYLASSPRFQVFLRSMDFYVLVLAGNE